MIKSNKEVTLKNRETCFFDRKPQKLKFSKNLANYFQKNYSYHGKWHSAKKKQKWPAIAE